jgi:lysozyme
MMTRDGCILGTDAAQFQRGANWQAVADMGVRFAICKATEATGHVDPLWTTHAESVPRVGILLGSYHVVWPNRDPIVQAQHYFSTAGLVAELPPVMDWELMKGVQPARVHDVALKFVEETERLWQRECIVYTYPSFAEQINGAMLTSPLGNRPLWIAHYGARTPRIPRPWKSWKWWQFDGDGGQRYPNGPDADFNWFHGTEAELLALARRGPTPSDGPDTIPSTPTSKSSQNIPAVDPGTGADDWRPQTSVSTALPCIFPPSNEETEK